MQMIMCNYYEQLCDNKLENLEEMDKFLHIHNLTLQGWEESGV